jgi:hypothetical protein
MTKSIAERKDTKRSKNPVIEYYRFYQSRIEPDVQIIRSRIEKSKTNETKMYIDDFARRMAMTGKDPHTIVENSRPALLIEDISVSLGDKERFIIMKKATQKERLTGQAKNLTDRVCRTDPQTDSPIILEFQSKICRLIAD